MHWSYCSLVLSHRYKAMNMHSAEYKIRNYFLLQSFLGFSWILIRMYVFTNQMRLKKYTNFCARERVDGGQLVVEGIDTEFSVMAVTPQTPKCHQMWWHLRLRLGCGDICESVVSQLWPKTQYQFPFYHGTTKLTLNLGDVVKPNCLSAVQV